VPLFRDTPDDTVGVSAGERGLEGARAEERARPSLDRMYWDPYLLTFDPRLGPGDGMDLVRFNPRANSLEFLRDSRIPHNLALLRRELRILFFPSGVNAILNFLSKGKPKMVYSAPRVSVSSLAELEGEDRARVTATGGLGEGGPHEDHSRKAGIGNRARARRAHGFTPRFLFWKARLAQLCYVWREGRG